eukprot:754728-Hanusia_phi.AAC.1
MLHSSNVFVQFGMAQYIVCPSEESRFLRSPAHVREYPPRAGHHSLEVSAESLPPSHGFDEPLEPPAYHHLLA